jgi:flagellar basal body-associated protein FliL
LEVVFLKKVISFVILTLVLAATGYITASRVWDFPVFGAPNNSRVIYNPRTSTINLGQFLTDLQDEGRFIRTTIEVEVYEENLETFSSHLAEAKTEIYALLRSKTYQELSGDKGLRDLQKDIYGILSDIYPKRIVEVFFSEFIVQ